MNAYIKHISYYLPEQKLTNNDLEQLFPAYSTETLLKKTGISERRIAAKDEIASDMAIKASEILLKETGVQKSEIDFMILTSQFLDYKTPATTSIIQDRLGLEKSIGSFDINTGCSGFVYSLSVAKGLVETQQASNVLLLSCDPMSHVLHPKDKGSRIIFGDAASAVLVSSRSGNGIGAFAFGTDGSKSDMLILKSGGMRNPYNKEIDVSEFVDEYGNVGSDDHFYMNGSDVLQSTIEAVPCNVKAALAKANLSIDDIDFFVFHQANAYLLEVLRRIIEIPSSKFIVDIEFTGNTVSCTIPIALRNAIDKSIIKKGNTVMLVSFGVGMSLASTIVTI